MIARVMRKREGFTLIELLVVIAIIAILAAILFPVFAKAREKARQSSCSNNMKQLGVAFITYSNDWDEKFPSSWIDKKTETPAAAIQSSAWDQQIAYSVKSDGVYKCPSNSLKKFSVHQPPTKQGTATVRTRVVSYGMNDVLLGVAPSANAPTDRTVPKTKSQASVNDPAGTILMGEMKSGNPSGAVGNGLPSSAEIHPWYHICMNADQLNEDKWNTKFGVARDAHSGGSIYLYVDSHVKWKKIAQTLGQGRGCPQAFQTLVGGVLPQNEWVLNNSAD